VQEDEEIGHGHARSPDGPSPSNRNSGMESSTEFESVRTAVLGLGSNIGNRLSHIRYALRELDRDPQTRVVRASSVYESEAHVLDPGDKQEPYLNAACMVETSHTPGSLLALCLRIEAARGRTRSAPLRWRPRTLDIDLLLYSDQSIVRPDLTVPHPRIPDRRFVLIPLFEIAPDLKIPSPIDRSVRYLLNHCTDDASVERYAGSEWKSQENE